MDQPDKSLVDNQVTLARVVTALNFSSNSIGLHDIGQTDLTASHVELYCLVNSHHDTVWTSHLEKKKISWGYVYSILPTSAKQD
ncbi:hypothetical protein E4T56_gene14636, partial [Termitomyces sp. T112]